MSTIILKPQWKRLVIFLVVAFSLAGMALVTYSTVWGPIVTSDSVYYIGSADNLVKGRGFGLPWGSGRFLIYAGDPPFYPLLIAGIELTGLSVVDAARWTLILSFGLTILAVGLLGWRASHSPGLALTLSVLLLTSALFTDMFNRAISEPVFFLTGISGALWLLCYLESARLGDLLLASVLLSAAFLTRFLGIALVLAAGFSLLGLGSLPWRTRLAHGVLFGAITGLPMLGWVVFSYTQTGGLGERYLHTTGSLWQATTSFRLAVAEMFWNWLPFSASFPASYGLQKVVLGLLLLVLLVGGGLVTYRSLHGEASRQANAPLLRWVCFFGLFVISFILVYALAFAHAIPRPDLNERLFSPLYIGGGFIIFGLMFQAMHSWPKLRWLVGLPVLALSLTMVENLPALYQNAQFLHQEGSGYTSRSWRQSPLIAALKQLPQDTPIITNEADAVLFLTGRPSVWLPDVIASQPVEAFYRFGDSPANLREEQSFRERRAALVIFPSITRQLESLYGLRSTERLETLTNGLAVYAHFAPLEAIYFYRPEFLP